MDRRGFIKATGVAVGVTAVRGLAGASQGVSIIVDPQDPIASAAPAAWAVRELQSALSGSGVTAQVFPRLDAAPAGNRYLVVAGGLSATAQQLLRSAKVNLPATAEALCLAPGNVGGRSVLLAGGSDARRRSAGAAAPAARNASTNRSTSARLTSKSSRRLASSPVRLRGRSSSGAPAPGKRFGKSLAEPNL